MFDSALVILISCLFGCSCFVLSLLDPSFYNLVFKILHCSSWVVAFHTLPLLVLPFFTCCHFSRIVVLFILLFLMCCHSSSIVALFALLFSHCNSRVATIRCFFHIVVLLSLPFLLCYYSFHITLFTFATPFILLFPSHYYSHIIAHFKYLLTQPLLFFLCCHCYSFHITSLFCLINMVLLLPLPRVSWSSKL